MATNNPNESKRQTGASTEGRSTATDAGRSAEMTRTEANRNTSLSRGYEWETDPFRQFRRFTDQMERWFDSFGLGAAGNRIGDWGFWAPQVETFQLGDQYVVRVDLPGMKKEDVNLEIRDDALIIQGERRAEHEDKREGYYRSERSYGSFYRTIPLPDGAITEDAKANFKDGVLEIAIPAPPATTKKSRRIEIGPGR